ncbi:MAG: type IV pilus assembly protein PilM [Planctomycetota bacterium]|jgi:type IV pilus assembly protein PilM|nr:type IV pilus assembly protein PilM [Planctomycetota bacterium]
MGSNVCWGVDIGYSSIKAVKVQRTKGALEILNVDVVEIESKSPDSDDYNREEAIREGLTIFRNRNKLKSDPVYVSIPGQGIFNRSFPLPPVPPAKVPEIVKFEAQQQIPFPIDEVIWDYQPIEGSEEATGELEVNLFAAKREIINNFLVNLKAADITVQGVQIAPLALYNFFTFDQPTDGALVVIDIGAENTDLVVIDGPKVWTRNLQFAGNDITRALKKKFQIPFEEAEKLKLKAKRSKQAKKIFTIIRPVLKDMVNEIHRSVGFYKSTAKGVKFERMVFLGNATKMMGFKRFFSQNLQYQVEVLEQIERVRVSPKANVNLFQEHLAGLPASIGLALQGLGVAANTIELIPEEMKQAKAAQQKKPFFVAACVIFALVLGLIYSRASSLHDQLNQVDSSFQGAGDPVQWHQKNQEKLVLAQDVQAIESNLELLAKIGKQRRIWIGLMEKLSTLAPEENQKDVTDFSSESLRQKVWFLRVEASLDLFRPETDEEEDFGEATPEEGKVQERRCVDVLMEVAAYYAKGNDKELARDLLEQKIERRAAKLDFSGSGMHLDLENHAPIWTTYPNEEQDRLTSELMPKRSMGMGTTSGMPKRYLCKLLSMRIFLEAPEARKATGTGDSGQ